MSPDIAGVFISYRRDETSHFAGRLYDRLAERFGERRVFMDVDSIRPGEDWTEAIREAVARCGLMLVLIGPRWSDVATEGRRRIDNPDDPVRLEIEAAFDHDIPVIPVVLENAVMPRTTDLPQSLTKLPHLQAIRMRHESFRSDSAWLLTVAEQMLAGNGEAAEPKEQHATHPDGSVEPARVDPDATRTGAGPPITPPTHADSVGPVGPRMKNAARRVWSRPRVVVPVIAVITVAAAAVVVAIVLSSGRAAASETLQPINTLGNDPYLPRGGKDINTKPPARAPGGAVRGDEPGLYGGTLEITSCDAKGILSFLRKHPDKAAAWASVKGVEPSQIQNFMADLTPLILRSDTRVTNHGFADGHATSFPAVLQAGTAVLVDTRGAPAAKCYCGNPLTPPQANPGPTYTGPRWPGFSAAKVTVVRPTTKSIKSFTVVDPTTGEATTQDPGTGIEPRPEGGTSSGSPGVSPPAGSEGTGPTEAPPTQAPPPTGNGGGGGSQPAGEPNGGGGP